MNSPLRPPLDWPRRLGLTKKNTWGVISIAPFTREISGPDMYDNCLKQNPFFFFFNDISKSKRVWYILTSKLPQKGIFCYLHSDWLKTNSFVSWKLTLWETAKLSHNPGMDGIYQDYICLISVTTQVNQLHYNMVRVRFDCLQEVFGEIINLRIY